MKLLILLLIVIVIIYLVYLKNIKQKNVELFVTSSNKSQIHFYFGSIEDNINTSFKDDLNIHILKLLDTKLNSKLQHTNNYTLTTEKIAVPTIQKTITTPSTQIQPLLENKTFFKINIDIDNDNDSDNNSEKILKLAEDILEIIKKDQIVLGEFRLEIMSNNKAHNVTLLELNKVNVTNDNSLNKYFKIIENKTSKIKNTTTNVIQQSGTTKQSGTTQVSIKYEDNRSSLEKKMTKLSCNNQNEKCLLAHEPYAEDDFIDDQYNKLNEKQIDGIKKRFYNKCKMNKDYKVDKCCDNTMNYDTSELSEDFLNKYKYVDIDKCGNNITKFRVCDSDDCGDGNWFAPSGYEYCKLLNVGSGDIDSDKNVSLDKLNIDCHDSKCNNNSVFLTINNKENRNEIITEHYYLVDAVKKDNSTYLIEYYNDYSKNVNTKLEYGYPGNALLHEILYYNAKNCLEYILTKDCDLSI